MTDDGFGTLMCQKCAQSQIRLGEWGIPLGGGGVGEPRTGIIYAAAGKLQLQVSFPALPVLPKFTSSAEKALAMLASHEGLLLAA